jgi:hypothetical protein
MTDFLQVMLSARLALIRRFRNLTGLLIGPAISMKKGMPFL